MSVDVIMPQMGESIAEGTITKWLKQVGEKIERDEPLFEISTDKVDAEIPSPASGILLEILVPEGETVAINTVLARIGEEAEVTAPSAKKSATRRKPAVTTAEAAPRPEPVRETAGDKDAQRSTRLKTKSSPLVRKIAKEHNINLALVHGTGAGGRVTKSDILSFIESAPKTISQVSGPIEEPPPMVSPEQKFFPEDERIVREPMSIMRKKIAEHMIRSRRTSAHVSTVFEVDMSSVLKRRESMMQQFSDEGVKLSFLPFIIEAVVKGLKAFPVINASIEDETIVYKKDINIGIAVALDWGLIVPVIKNADNMSLLGLAKAVNDLAERARSKHLKPEEVQNGTFSITNPGVFGSIFGAPIINQPQVAILGVGAITKRTVVVNDAIAIRPMVYLSLSFDHRLIDGAVADQFMAYVKKELEISPRETPLQ
jgi:pyruvate dehydrogenase E2 component (dihydrolipoamide acetyltransferase)